jgi:hypothetical protein
MILLVILAGLVIMMAHELLRSWRYQRKRDQERMAERSKGAYAPHPPQAHLPDQAHNNDTKGRHER